MFPDFRLMIAAIAASVVALSCGFGVFAALRVNHEPLSRLPSPTAPLQLVSENLAPPTIPSGRPTATGEPEIAPTAANESARESARNDGGETASSAPSTADSIAEPETAASAADEKTQGAAQPANPPVTSSTALAADDHTSGAVEPEPMSTSAEGGDAPRAQGETAAAAEVDEAKADKPAETAAEPAPIATPKVAGLELAPESEIAAAEPTTPIERRVLADEQTAPAEQSAPADQDAPPEQTAAAAPTAFPNEVARLNLEDNAGDASDAAPAHTRKIVRKKHSKARVAANTARKHRTRVAARFKDPMFGQPRFLTAPQAFSTPARMHRAARRTPGTTSAVGGPFVTTQGR